MLSFFAIIGTTLRQSTVLETKCHSEFLFNTFCQTDYTVKCQIRHLVRCTCRLIFVYSRSDEYSCHAVLLCRNYIFIYPVAHHYTLFCFNSSAAAYLFTISWIGFCYFEVILAQLVCKTRQ